MYFQGRIDKLVPDIVQMALTHLQQPIEPVIDEDSKYKIMLILVSLFLKLAHFLIFFFFFIS